VARSISVFVEVQELMERDEFLQLKPQSLRFKENRMSRPPLSSIAVSAATLICAPILVAFGLDGMPSLATMRASKTADILGVWTLTWGLILLGVAGAVTVSWLAWGSDAEARRLAAATDHDRPASTPQTPDHRSVA
jgi:hypothetical protein